MPEGPEIKRVADTLADSVLNQPLQAVWFARPDLARHNQTLTDSRIIEVRTKGKALLTVFDCNLTVYSHNQLYGRWYFVKAGRQPNTNRQLRMAFHTAEQSALLYSASDIEVLTDDELNNQPFLKRAGIDILSDQPSLAALTNYLKQPKFARRALGGLLLDQGFIAGSGNYLRSEIMFTAGLHPAIRPGDLNGHQIRKLARQIIRIITQAYETGGITNDLDRANKLKSAGWKRSDYRHHVFYRSGQICHQCNAVIEKMTVASRRLYRCPGCQPAP